MEKHTAKKYSLPQKLFRTYAGSFLLCFLIVVCLSVWYVGSVIRQNIEDTRQRLTASMDKNVETYFEEMNNFSMSLLNSADFKKAAIDRLPRALEEKRGTSQIFSGMYLDAYQMIQKDYSLGIAVENKYYIWMGSNYYISRIPRDSEIHTYDALERNEKPYIRYLKKNQYLEKTAGDRYREDIEKSYVTLSRSMDSQKKYLNGRAVLEILLDGKKVQEDMARFSGSSLGQGFLMNVYDSEGNPIYEEFDLLDSKYIQSKGVGRFEEKGARIEVHSVFGGRVSVVYVIDRLVYYKKLLSFVGMALVMCVLVCVIITVITYKISKQISKPIHQMCENVQEINLEKGIHYEDVGTNIDELKFLSHSLKDMSTQLGISLEHIITLKDYETHAKMLALQAQMQPHFLVNTLTTMGAMAEEEGNHKVAAMCMNLNQMFRYISTEAVNGVKMFEEIRHVERYVEIMKERFPDAEVELDIPLEVLGCPIPKLTIQPLVENAFKYCNRKKPWIRVQGSMTANGRWQVLVEDNGSGFSAEKIGEIMEKCREGLKEEKVLSNQIDGMGLVNVYVRLQLFYGESMIYRIEEGKSRIVIGGKTDV